MIDSLYNRFLERKWIPDIKGGSLILFCFSTAFLFYFYDWERDTMSYTVKNVADFCIN